MSRIASSLYDGDFEKLQSSYTSSKVVEPSLNVIKLNNSLVATATNNHRSQNDWAEVFPTAAFFEGDDIKLGYIVVMVYEDPDTTSISTVLFSALGELCMNSITIDARSRFYGACENVKREHRHSNVRRALAITLLKAYSVYNHADLSHIMIDTPTSRLDWDETIAGETSSGMRVISLLSPVEIGKRLLAAGFLQPHYLESMRLDVIYEDIPEAIDANNKLVFLLGQQLEHLFDPLTEYSPEAPDTLYKAPASATRHDNVLVKSICDELLQLQESITTQLVQFLREVVIPLRIKALNGVLPNLSASDANQVFPPTVDEITRVNCMFLEALKSAAPFGSFEVMKACGITIPYFYKAYMRHESALKSFSKSLRNFLQFYSENIPEDYTPAKIESIMKVPLNLPKIKLILERLAASGSWTHIEEQEVRKFSKGAIDTIDSFGKDNLKPYSRRVFTPTGKILTEICEGWPSILAYGWLNRKVISVHDFNKDGTNGVMILFNDYVVFAEVEESDDTNTYSPRISDVLMNSLINENPINKIPSLKVLTWTDLMSLEVSGFGDYGLKFLLIEDPELNLAVTVDDPSKVIGLINKAKILGKSTPFHLFKNEKFGLTIYATAHERAHYEREHSRSNIALFLNVTANQELLEKHKLFAAISVRFVDEDMIHIVVLTQEGETFAHTINPSELSSLVSEELSGLETRRRSSQRGGLFTLMALNYRSSLKCCTLVVKKQALRSSARTASPKSSLNPKRLSSISSADTNKPLPEIVERDITPGIQLRDEPAMKQTPTKKQFKLKNRLSKIFGFNNNNTKKKSTESMIQSSKIHEGVSPLQKQLDTLGRKKVSITRNIPTPPAFPANSFDPDIPEVASTVDDCKTFESSMSAIFDDDDKDSNVNLLAGHNWTIERENSSFNCSLDKQWQFNTAGDQLVRSSSVKKIVPLFGLRAMSASTLRVVSKNPSQEKGVEATQHPKPITPQERMQAHFADYVTPPNAMDERDITFNSIDDNFNSPILRIPVSSNDGINDRDTFYTPISESADLFRFEDMMVMGGVDKSFDLDSFDGEEIATLGSEKHLDEPIQRGSGGENTDEATAAPDLESIFSDRSLSFKSCLNESQLAINGVMPTETLDYKEDASLFGDESFRYLAGILDNPITEQKLRGSDTYGSLPRSYSSYRYLASFIDSDLNISSDLYSFLHEQW